jgi:hypothetical protein
MNQAEIMSLAGPCGIYCGECECHQAADNPALLEFLVSRGIRRDRLPCPGCRPLEGNCPVLAGTCTTYACAQANKVEFCYDCLDFPCAKVFSLCSLKQKGLEAWSEQYPELKRRYFKGRMVVGSGPQLE